MISRVLEGTRQPRKKAKCPTTAQKEESSKTYRSSLTSFHASDDEDDGEWCGLGGDLPLTFCNGGGAQGSPSPLLGRYAPSLGLREVLRSSVQVLGMSGLGVTEKVVLVDGSTFTAKRFRRARVGRCEFGNRVELFARLCAGCRHLVPVRAYLYAKRTKLVLCDYYPMGSLADLLAGARELGHTPLDWYQRAKIILHVARAIAYIHAQPPVPGDKRLRMSIHGNIKASNVFVETDFTACLSDYGFYQLAKPLEVPNPGRPKRPPSSLAAADDSSEKKSSQQLDVFHFGVMVLDVLGGPRAPHQAHCIVERMEEIKEGTAHFYEYFVEGRAKRQAAQLLELALACAKRSPEDRPSADQILTILTNVLTAE